MAELEYTFIYKCKGEHITHIKSKDGSDNMREKEVLCDECGEGTSYAGFEPQKTGLTTKVEYEKNGRKAIAIRDKDGNMSYVSKTRLHYNKTGRIENQYSEGRKRQIVDRQVEDTLRSNYNKSKANVTQASAQKHMEEMVKNLPDGEYLSDGSEVVGGVDNN